MVTPTTTTEAINKPCVSCAAESDFRGTAQPSLFDFAAVFHAYRACRRGKRSTSNAQRYELALLDRLVDTSHALQLRRWRPSRSHRFVVTHPKPREVLAPSFNDRVVHHLLVPRLERLYEPVFIFDSFANRKGKGVHAAVERLQRFTRQGAGLHYLQLDIASFFNSVNRRLLFDQLQWRLSRDSRRPAADPRHLPQQEADEIRWLCRVLLTGNPAESAVFHGRRAELARVPAHKQLANAAPETGLPIGNLTSQFFANVYLNALDQFIKHQLKVRFYLRYVDDFVLLHTDPRQLMAWRDAIREFLHQKLRLALRDEGKLAPVSNGIDFLGYIVRPGYRLVRRRVVQHLQVRMKVFSGQVSRQAGQLYDYPPGKLAQVQATLASYFGHFRHAQSATLRQGVFKRYPWLGHGFALTPEGRLFRCDAPASVSSLASQWRYFRTRYPSHLILVRVGNRVHAWQRDARVITRASRCVGSSLVNTGPSLIGGVGWPIHLGSLLRRRLRANQLPYAYIDEAGWLKGGMKRRELRQLYTPFKLWATCKENH